ncbi:TonB-dependent receptor domain-containing protein [Halioglobus pacificus]|uniref:TonB-dependent receptor n=1 Tax=Parahalioglobus pacificus TaxID=930806 RepID=A0A919CLA5_9GAMM|nr:TonB-dependent receptor [Halioglobus pacificus]GHD36239.1 TonB-dependent receptor [Halioglobus pacificus]
MKTTFKRRPLSLACASALTLLSATALAQDETANLEEVLVTGSHIKGLDLKGGTQAIQLNRQDILESGALRIGELMQDLTVTGGGSGTFTTATAGALSGDTPVGASSVSLRGLGTGSTLTLINGRRSTVSSFANGQASFIDVNSIPAAAIERIEILPSGASATYGADAVAGVINYELRKDYEGFEITGSYGDSTDSTDEGRYNLNLAAGVGNERHHVMAIVDYYKRNAMFNRDRDVSAVSKRPSQQGFFPSFNDLFFADSQDQVEKPENGGCAAEDFGIGNFGEFCEVNTNAFTSVLDEFESIGGVFTYNFQVNENTTWFNEVLYQSTESDGTSSPANFSRAPFDPESPLWPQELIDDLIAVGDNGGADDWSDFFGFPVYAWGKIPEPRAVSVESETYRLVSGLEIDFDNGWNLETAFTYGSNESEQRGISGLVVAEAFYDAALGNLCTDGSRVERWDVDPARPDADFIGNTCEDDGRSTLWYNPFNGQASQADGIDEALRTTARRNGDSEMYSLDFVTSGTLFEFNNREIQAAFGGEWRHEEVKDVPSGIAVATTTNPEPILGFSSTSADAERDQWALFAEFYIPLTDNLDLTLAGRYDDYDTFGGDFNPKVALRWQPLESLILRTNYSTSYRAPSLAQVGAGTLLSSYTVNCVETPGACDGIDEGDGESLFSEDVANDNLEPETADTWGAGFVWSPTQDIDLTVDYWSISYDDVIGIDEDDFIRRALAGQYPVVGEGELPTGEAGLEVEDGFVVDAHFELSNLGFEDVSGIDLAYTQSIDVGAATITLLADMTYLIEYERQSSDASPVIDEAGEFLYPELLANAKVRYDRDTWGGSLGLRYTDGYRDDPSPRTLEAVGLPSDARVDVDSWTVLDLNLYWDMNQNNTLALTVRNLTDEEPPEVLGLSSNVDYLNHDSMGRYITLRYTYGF